MTTNPQSREDIIRGKLDAQIKETAAQVKAEMDADLERLLSKFA